MGAKLDDRVIVCVADLLDGKLPYIKYKNGFTARSITSDRGNSRAYSTILFRLMELLILDVIEGHIVYFDRERKSRFYVEYYPASPERIAKEGLDKNSKCIPIDFSKTKYRVPFIAFDPGYRGSPVCQCDIPPYLYDMLVEEVNKGKVYTKGTKVYFASKLIT